MKFINARYVAADNSMIAAEREEDGETITFSAIPGLVCYDTLVASGAEIAPFAGRRLVPKSTIVDRLNDAGKLSDASKALNADLYARERWYAPDKPGVYADDAEVLALLKVIGADPAVILAP